MTIPWFLAIACLMLVLIALFTFFQSRKRKLDDKNKRIWAWATLLVFVLGILSPIVVRKYIYPKDTRVFNNADYHVLEHTGFNVPLPFSLVNEEELPIAALYDSKEGLVKLDHNDDGEIVLTTNEFYEPLYVTKYDKKKAQLLNRYFPDDISKGFSITCGDNEIYALEIKPNHKWKDHCYYISSINGHHDTSEFTRKIKKGYLLSHILSSTPGLEMAEETRAILDGIMLVREKYGVGGSDLILMPNQCLSTNPNIKVKKNTKNTKKDENHENLKHFRPF